MIIDKKLIDSFVRTTERAAYGASTFKGRNNKIAADQAAVDEMRNELNTINVKVNWIKHQCFILMKRSVQKMVKILILL